MVFLLFGVFLGGVLGAGLLVGFGVRFGCVLLGFGVFVGVVVGFWWVLGFSVGVLGCFLVGFWGQGFRFWGFFAWLGLGFRFPGGPGGFFAGFWGCLQAAQRCVGAWRCGGRNPSRKAPTVHACKAVSAEEGVCVRQCLGCKVGFRCCFSHNSK